LQVIRNKIISVDNHIVGMIKLSHSKKLIAEKKLKAKAVEEMRKLKAEEELKAKAEEELRKSKAAEALKAQEELRAKAAAEELKAQEELKAKAAAEELKAKQEKYKSLKIVIDSNASVETNETISSPIPYVYEPVKVIEPPVSTPMYANNTHLFFTNIDNAKAHDNENYDDIVAKILVASGAFDEDSETSLEDEYNESALGESILRGCGLN
jgi:multidrug efflux pump subunit AcrA (membrane-fusion protein)